MNRGPVLRITVAVFLHSVGTLGVYERYEWYDEATHTVSSAPVAALPSAAFRALELHAEGISGPGEFRTVFVVVFVPAFAISWEVPEFASGDLIPVYRIDDIATDVIANTPGAVIVTVWWAGPMDGVFGCSRDRSRSEAA